MTSFTISIDEEALIDIQQGTDWYNQQLDGLGQRFQKQVKSQILSLKRNHSSYSIRYKDVRCMPIKKFPFMVHFSVDESQRIVEVFAVIHTRRNPSIWKK